MTNKCFYQLTHYPTLPDFYIQEALTAKIEISRRPVQYRAISTFSNSDFFKSIEEHFHRKCLTWYYITKPKTYFDWHTDERRNFAINWLVKEAPNAGGFYRNPIEEVINPLIDPLIYDLVEIPYTLGKPTVLNTGLTHCVINNSNETRIILSMSVGDIDYEFGLEYFSKLQPTSY
jgi:hypothetical protein